MVDEINEMRKQVIDSLEKSEALLEDHGIQVTRKITRYEITKFPIAMESFVFCFEKAIGGKKMQWLPEYDQVVEWLRDNKGKGLLLSGSCGIGKSMIACKVIPMMFGSRGQILHPMNAKQFSREGKIDGKVVWIIDDLGTEGAVKDYGTEVDKISELLDKIDLYGGMAVITTNLNTDELRARYGGRNADRMRHNFETVYFQSKQSMR